MSRVYNQEQLYVLLDEWVDRLCLQEWDITVGIYRERDFYHTGSVGENTFNISSAKSTIRIIDPCDYPENTKFPQDMETTLVHELLHLKFAAFEPADEKSLQHAMWERTLQVIARTLVTMKYEKRTAMS